MIPLGRVYVVDVESIRDVTMFNTDHGRYHSKQIATADGGWVPLECLEPVQP